MVRLFALYAAISLVPVLGLGVVLAASYRAEAARRGVAEGSSEARLIAQTAVEPALGSHPLSQGLTDNEQVAMHLLSASAIANHNVLRLRLRDLDGKMVFSDDGSGFNQAPEDEALDAAHGQTVSLITQVNADANDSGPAGDSSVEVYLPLHSAATGEVTGVLELYLPYAPIRSDIAAGLFTLYRDLALGLLVLYLALFVISASVTRRLRQQVAINAHLAEHDQLTGLPNRELFHRLLAERVAATRDRQGVLLAIVDLDRFREINDTLGHRNGDLLLVELSRRLREHLPGADVARLGGDEFGLIVPDVTEPYLLLNELRALLQEEVSISGISLSVEASIGYVMAPEDGTDVDELLQRADVAMYAAKEQDAGVVRYDHRHNPYTSDNLSVLAELRVALESDQLVLHYQPQSGLQSGRVEAVEALVRWEHPERGLVPPDQFIPLAEQTDLIHRITSWVMRRALLELRNLDSTGTLKLAVNVSARNLARTGFAQEVVDLLAELDMPAGRLILEVTETALLADPIRAAVVLGELAAAGVHISLDDFGCGQTSLGYLAALPLNEIKIDRSFIGDMLSNTAHDAIVRSVVELGHNLALRVVGEGVENDEVLRRLRGTGCDLVQGYFIARPMPAVALARWLGEAREALALTSG
jgi:diguanylate cyclase (GGDEF)-like protein